MEIIRVKTPRGLELKGAIFGDYTMDTVVIIMSGICSNVFQNDLLPVTGELLSSNNIAFIAYLCSSSPAYVGESGIFSKTGDTNANMQYHFKLQAWSTLDVFSRLNSEFPTPENYYTVSYTNW